MKDGAPVRVAYYATDERTEAGEVLFALRYYSFKGRCQSTMSVPASLLNVQLDLLRKQHISTQRIT